MVDFIGLGAARVNGVSAFFLGGCFCDFAGCFAKNGCFVVVNLWFLCGDLVVKTWCYAAGFSGAKICHFLKIFFWEFPKWEWDWDKRGKSQNTSRRSA
jgi:hypothetical protein